MSSCIFLFFCFCLSHPYKYEPKSLKTNSQVHIQTHKRILDLIWLNVLRNSSTVPYLLVAQHVFFVPSGRHTMSPVQVQTHKPNHTKINIDGFDMAKSAAQLLYGPVLVYWMSFPFFSMQSFPSGALGPSSVALSVRQPCPHHLVPKNRATSWSGEYHCQGSNTLA